MNFKENISINKKLKEKKTLNNFFNKFGMGSKILIILITLIITFIFLIPICIKSKKYSILYNQLSNKDGGNIISQLVKMNIPYRFNETSGVLLVPDDRIQEIRFNLAKHGLPKGSGIGFELLDKEKFGISQFNEQVNYQRALEGELARTIERLNLIKSARIHIALPKSSLFIREKKAPTASIILDLQPGQYLDRNQINAILHFISSSVSGLTPNHITIVDQSGNLLNNLDFIDHEINDIKIRYTEELEKRYKKRIEDILSPIMGLENIRAQVTAQIDFNNQERTEEKYKPNFDDSQQAIRSHQSTYNTDLDGKGSNILIASDSSKKLSNISEKNINNIKNIKESDNSKIADINLKNNGNTNKNSYDFKNFKNSHDDVINYELDHTILRTKVSIGEIKRLSTAVVVNFVKDNQGKSVPLSINLMKKIENLTRQVVGYSKVRGDTLHIVNSLFVNDSNFSKTSNKNMFHANSVHLVKKIDEKNINNSNNTEGITTLYFIWEKLIKSDLLLKFYPFTILFLFFLVLFQFIFLRKKNNQYKTLYIQYMNKKDNEKKVKINNSDKSYFEENININNNGIRNTSDNLSKNNVDIIEKIVREWTSDKKL
ncbi:flagellar basal-body MS-ring/collar protein FliF [Buchnera aphidicola]|uniref:flagellar basal-body MS-ring/collar protein FliF n=1 Tax=Buchnera aphidicola TaxID=9 RepID=UPI00346499C6